MKIKKITYFIMSFFLCAIAFCTDTNSFVMNNTKDFCYSDKKMAPARGETEKQKDKVYRNNIYTTPVPNVNFVNYEIDSGNITFEIFDRNCYSLHDVITQDGNICLEESSLYDRSIIGSDDRTLISNPKVTPFKATGLLVAQWILNDDTVIEGEATAFLQGDSIALTAAHCVFDDFTDDNVYNPTFASSISIYFACENQSDYDQGNEYAYYCEVEIINIEYAYYESMNGRHDWALLTIDRDFGETLGWYSRKSNWFVEDYNVFAYGYPADKTHGTMWQGSGTLISYDWDYYHYTIDTTPGMSGGPVFETDANGHIYMVAIHTGGTTTYNVGVKINSLIFAYITSFNSSYQGSHTYEYLTFEINSKSGSTWHINIINNSSNLRHVCYNTKMCFDNDAINWTNLNNLNSIWINPYSSVAVDINENWFATTICCAYVYNQKRVISYANNLNIFTYTLSMHYSLIIA